MATPQTREALIFLAGAAERYVKLVDAYMNCVKSGSVSDMVASGMQMATNVQRALVEEIQERVNNGDV